MNASEPNLKFEYLYRDGGNYKQFGFIILQNPEGISPELATKQLQKHLIDGEFFDPAKVNVPPLEKHAFDYIMDHCWYEFEKFSYTNEQPTQSDDLNIFLMRFISTNSSANTSNSSF